MNKEQAQAIKNIVNSHLEIDVDLKTRKDLYVKGRAICYKILRDECLFTYDFDDDYLNLRPLQLKKEVNDLKCKNKTLTQLVKEANIKLAELADTSENKWGKYKSIIDIMEQRVPDYKLNRVEKRLKEIINGL